MATALHRQEPGRRAARTAVGSGWSDIHGIPRVPCIPKGAGPESRGPWNKYQSADWFLCRESPLMEGHGLPCAAEQPPHVAAPAARRGQMGSSCLSLPGCRAGSACSPSAEGETPLCRQTVALPAPGQIVMLTGNPCRRSDASPGEGASSKTEFWSNLLHQTLDFGFPR